MRPARHRPPDNCAVNPKKKRPREVPRAAGRKNLYALVSCR
jgi:hypothetical protein